jgi:hypothetical protein
LKIINLTPHAINLVLGSVSIHLPSEGEARVTSAMQSMPPICAEDWRYVMIPTEQTQYVHVTGLPAPTAGVAYIVSLVAVEGACRAMRSLHDLFSPGRQIRDADGKVTGCASLVRHGWIPAVARSGGVP